MCRPAVQVTEKQAVRFANGGALDLGRTGLARENPAQGAEFRVCSSAGEFLGLGRVSEGELRVLRLF